MLPDVTTLHAENIDNKPRDFDFTPEGFDEIWCDILPNVEDWSFERCQAWLDDRGYDEVPGQLEYDEDPDGILDEIQERVTQAMIDDESYLPMMNYVYPIHLDRHLTYAEAQAKLDDLPVVLVLIKDSHDPEYSWADATPYLALSGGGMDLSWEICEAYIRVGQLPPVHFCDLPGMAGRGESERDQRIIRACHESLRIAGLRIQHTRDMLYRTYGVTE